MNTKRQITIFIVDDNKVFSMALKGAIENTFGHLVSDICLFESGEDCLRNLSDLKPELIILDYFLNGNSSVAADGIKVLEEIKKSNSDASVIMLTSNDHIDIALKSFHRGVSDYVVKTPDQFLKINQAISNIFAKREQAVLVNAEEKLAADRIIASKELEFVNGEKDKWAAELFTANTEKTAVERSMLLVEVKNKEITDSINYAKRIQLAKLPREEDIYASLPKSFVLFKPKDIVSGDFYFFHKNNTSVFIVAADCTGHGVPGAFMSMIGSEKLAEAVAVSSDTSEILKILNKGIKNSLQQSESKESARDGMDIAICSIDTETRTISYAGANRPFWLIRNGSSELEEIKATKKAIGGHTEHDQHFESHKLQLQKGDTFYLATDGYADQFGFVSRKKLMSKKFKEILLSIRNMTMHHQREHLDSFIENWKSGIEQVDDILVVGVRLC